MNDKLFVIAIGGTGMRCLESFIHLCAVGMFDNQEIDILTLDTDQNNGNKSRVEALVELYNKVKANDETKSDDNGNVNTNTFFSAKLNLYKFFTDYSTLNRKSYAVLSQVSNLTQEEAADNQDMADLLLDRETVQQFELDHGYRAQTHLGSMLMYHGIVEAAISAKRGDSTVKSQEKELADFVQLINKNAANARIFVFGSVFGGTGASSIPVIPIALRDSVNILSGGTNTLDLDKVKFGSTLLTDYFSFNPPTDAQRQRQHVIADSNNFALNSQAALQFYLGDPTVKNFYKRLYHIGWPASQKLDVTGEKAETVTGGAEQENPCHVVELMAACAAYDFFTADSINEKEATYYYRNVEADDNHVLQLTGKSFMGEDGDKFENKLGAFFSFAHIVLSTYGGAQDMAGTDQFIRIFGDQKINDYDTIPESQTKEIDEYMKKFAYNFVKGTIRKGWIYQIKDSLGAGSFIFKGDAFKSSPNELRSIDPGNIFTNEMHNWDKSMLKSRYDKFIGGLISPNAYPMDDQNVTTTKEKFMAHIYNAITIAQHYDS